MPDRTSFFGGLSDTPGQSPDPIYDETGMICIEEFANRVQEGIFPAGAEWGRFEAGEAMPDDFRFGLAEVQRYMFQLLDRTNLGVELADSFRDMAGPGNMCLKAVPGDWQAPIHWQAIPLADVWVTPGAHGRWRDIHVRYRKTRAEIAEEHPGADLPDGFADQAPTELVPVFDSWLRVPGAVTEQWRYQTHVDGKLVLAEGKVGGAGSCSYIFGRWGKNAGELYGSGQGMKALPAIAVTNEVVRQILSHADMALAGMWQAEDDGVLNPWTVRLAPGTIIPIAPGSRGLQPLQLPSNRLDIGGLQLEEQRHNIKKALYAETLGPREGTPPSAFEVQQRMAELARQIGPSFLRVWHEIGVPVLQRSRWLLERRGLIEMPMIDNRRVKVAAASALVRAAQIGDVRRINEWLGGIAANFGPQAVQQMVDAERYVRMTGERLDIPGGLIFSPRQMQQNAAMTGEILAEAGQATGQGPALAMAPLLAQLQGGQR